MINAFHGIIQYEEDKWEEYLNKICLIDIFGELINEFGADPQLLKSYMRYIVWAYSFDSDMIIIGTDWHKNKEKIFEAAGFEPIKELKDKTVYLKDKIVLSTIMKWLNFQDSAAFCQLCVLKDLLVEMQLSANSPIVKSSGEIDYDQKYKNSGYAKELRENIKDLESELIQNSDSLKEGYKEATKKSKSKVETMGPESFVQNKNK